MLIEYSPTRTNRDLANRRPRKDPNAAQQINAARVREALERLRATPEPTRPAPVEATNTKAQRTQPAAPRP